MIPRIGQRWKFRRDGLEYISEVVDTHPKFKMQVVQVIDNTDYKDRCLNSIFEPKQLNIFGESVICEWLLPYTWAYLEGQDRS